MNKCLGVFDSGLGGLSVLKELLRHNTYDEILYFGDTGRVPYGTRSRDTIIAYSMQDMRFLLSRGAQEVIIACNTVSAVALDSLCQRFFVPIRGVIEASAPAAVRRTKNGRIGVIATAATVKNGAYEKAIRALSPDAEVFSIACPLFVPLVEYGFTAPDNEITAKTCEYYLAPLKDAGVDTVIMGCTHYPVIEAAIQNCLGESVTLINNGKELAALQPAGEEKKPRLSFFVSDDPESFDRSRECFMPGVETEEKATWVDISKY